MVLGCHGIQVAGVFGVITYKTLFLLFSMTSTLLSLALVVLARTIRQIQMPPQDEDFDKLLSEKASLETQLAQEQNQLSSAKSTLESLENDLNTRTAELEAAKAGVAT